MNGVLDACGAPLADARDDLPRWKQPRVSPSALWSRPPAPTYPTAALDAGIETGFAVLGCVVGPERRLQNCRIERESHRGIGFGAAALEAVGSGRLSPETDWGPRPGEVMTLMIRFMI